MTKSFRGLLAVNDLSFSISQGEIVGLIGPNGAGKTSAFNLIAGVYKPDTGIIKLQGKTISGKSSSKISSLGIARTFQIVKPFPRMSVIENAMVGALFGRDHSMSTGSSRNQAFESLEYVGLKEKALLPASELTLAEQRRLELARAIASKPVLLMLDEIMSGLNNSEIAETLDLLRKVKQDKELSILFIEHVMFAVTSLCERLVVMDHGQKLAEGTPSEIVSNIKVIEAYMGRSASSRPKSATESPSTPLRKEEGMREEVEEEKREER